MYLYIYIYIYMYIYIYYVYIHIYKFLRYYMLRRCKEPKTMLNYNDYNDYNWPTWIEYIIKLNMKRGTSIFMLLHITSFWYIWWVGDFEIGCEGDTLQDNVNMTFSSIIWNRNTMRTSLFLFYLFIHLFIFLLLFKLPKTKCSQLRMFQEFAGEN